MFWDFEYLTFKYFGLNPSVFVCHGIDTTGAWLDLWCMPLIIRLSYLLVYKIFRATFGGTAALGPEIDTCTIWQSYIMI